ncbi:seminal metalloprotease 1-like [Anopheles ziemanni]|uniref:seminal metalloprotease 1-like n=1 Tax=Anopheles coustani TaxID=139045 RepID=UPI00265A6647|nr:seminal metalloprotease 1-like [Anopheles coustani]XP_058170365.1 seminal metalloprotease 1-like [Anopheles ziemanni]
MFHFQTFSLAVLCVALAQARVLPNSPENIARLRQLRPGELAEELSGQFEGDIVLTEEQERDMLANRRNGLIAEIDRWPNNVIPVLIQEEDFTPEQVEYIKRGMRQLEAVSCVKFVKFEEKHEDFVRLSGYNSGCYSSVGRRGRSQVLNLQPYPIESGCFNLATIMHEFLHTLGFYHQQSASDRDEYVDIIWENIQEGREHNFEKFSPRTVTDFNVRYDYGSVMHYSATAFSMNDQPTIVPKDPKAEIGQRVGLSERDISKLNHMYKCLVKG